MSPFGIDHMLRMALGHHQAGRLTQAEALYQQILAQSPNHDGALHGMGILALQRSRPDIAVEYFQRATELQPNNPFYFGNLGNALLALGKADEAAASYRRALELKPDFAEAHNTLGDALVRQGNIEEAIASYRRALELRPNYAAAHKNLGDALSNRGRWNDAITAYRRAVELNPNDLGVHNNLGIALKNQGKRDEAVAAYRRALELAPEFPEANNNLGNALKEQGKLDEAIDFYRRALEKSPDYAEAHKNLGNALKDLGQFDEAEGHLNEAVRLRPDDDEAYLSRSILWLLRGDFDRGWPEYEWRWRTKKFSVKRRTISQPRWDGSPLEGRTILLHAEQGLGDTLNFIRYAPLVFQLGGKVVVECQPALKRLLQQSLGAIPVFDYSEPLPSFDVHCPLLSLPLACGTTLENIPQGVPYVHADPDATARWRARLADAAGSLTVGLAWAGNRSQPNDYNRSMPLTALAPLEHVPGVRYFSLQKGERARSATDPVMRNLVDWTDEWHDFADTAALVASLDLVISVDTSVSHLAGAMGRPVWTMLSFAADWRYLLDRDDSPWYPTMRLFRQPSLGDWASVVSRVADELRHRAGAMIPLHQPDA